MAKERIVVLTNGMSFAGRHVPNWVDFDKIFKVTDKRTIIATEVGDIVKVTRSEVLYQVFPQTIKK